MCVTMETTGTKSGGVPSLCLSTGPLAWTANQRDFSHRRFYMLNRPTNIRQARTLLFAPHWPETPTLSDCPDKPRPQPSARCVGGAFAVLSKEVMHEMCVRVCVVLRNTQQRRPLCQAETSAHPGRFLRVHCEERRTVKPSHCCTETERRCSEEPEDKDRQTGKTQEAVTALPVNISQTDSHLQSAEDARVFHTLMSCQLTETTAEDIEVPQNLKDKDREEIIHWKSHTHTWSQVTPRRRRQNRGTEEDAATVRNKEPDVKLHSGFRKSQDSWILSFKILFLKLYHKKVNIDFHLCYSQWS